jgi:hypothetical protein
VATGHATPPAPRSARLLWPEHLQLLEKERSVRLRTEQTRRGNSAVLLAIQ